MAKENCGLSQSQIDQLPPGYLQNVFVNSLQPKIKAKVQLTVGWTGRPMTELMEIAQHHWDNCELKDCEMQEMLMLAQVSHYTGGATRGGGRYRRPFRRRDQNQRQPRNSDFKGNCYCCGEADHWMKDCPYMASHAKPTLPTAPPVSSQMEDQQTPQYHQ